MSIRPTQHIHRIMRAYFLRVTCIYTACAAMFLACSPVLAFAVPADTAGGGDASVIQSSDNQRGDNERTKDMLFLKKYLQQECMPISQGIAFRLRVNGVSSARIPISVPKDIANEMRKVRYIHGTVSERGCDIDLDDDQSIAVASLRTARRGLFGIVWEKPSLSDDDFSDGLCGYFPLCYNENELKLWPLDLLLACISPVSLNSPQHYAFAERSGIVVRTSSDVRKSYEFNSKIPDGPHDTVVLDCSDDMPACLTVIWGRDSGRSCPDGRYSALGGHKEHSGKKISVSPGYAIYDHVSAQLLNGLEFTAVLLEVRLLSPASTK